MHEQFLSQERSTIQRVSTFAQISCLNTSLAFTSPKVVVFWNLYFLWGKEFTVLTHNITLTYLKAFHMKSKQLSRRASEIEASGYKIVQCKGSSNIVADCLSGASVDPVTDEPDHLEGHRDINMRVLALTYNANHILERIRFDQEKDFKRFNQFFKN